MQPDCKPPDGPFQELLLSLMSGAEKDMMQRIALRLLCCLPFSPFACLSRKRRATAARTRCIKRAVIFFGCGGRARCASALRCRVEAPGPAQPSPGPRSQDGAHRPPCDGMGCDQALCRSIGRNRAGLGSRLWTGAPALRGSGSRRSPVSSASRNHHSCQA